MVRAWAGVVLLAASAAVAAQAGDAKSPQLRYEFTLQKGQGVPVCEAYVLRLRATRFARPPYCDRPENDSVPGFAKLARVPLTRTEIENVFASAEGLLRFDEPEFYEKVEEPYITDTLAVLLRSGGKTSLQCEILWHDPDHEWDERLEEERKLLK